MKGQQNRIELVTIPGPNQRSTAAVVKIAVSDVNDSPPAFSNSRYSAVVPENSPVNTLVTRITAQDPDTGLAGEVHYALAGMITNF